MSDDDNGLDELEDRVRNKEVREGLRSPVPDDPTELPHTESEYYSRMLDIAMRLRDEYPQRDDETPDEYEERMFEASPELRRVRAKHLALAKHNAKKRFDGTP